MQRVMLEPRRATVLMVECQVAHLECLAFSRVGIDEPPATVARGDLDRVSTIGKLDCGGVLDDEYGQADRLVAAIRAWAMGRARSSNRSATHPERSIGRASRGLSRRSTVSGSREASSAFAVAVIVRGSSPNSSTEVSLPRSRLTSANTRPCFPEPWSESRISTPQPFEVGPRSSTTGLCVTRAIRAFRPQSSGFDPPPGPAQTV